MASPASCIGEECRKREVAAGGEGSGCGCGMPTLGGQAHGAMDVDVEGMDIQEDQPQQQSLQHGSGQVCGTL